MATEQADGQGTDIWSPTQHRHPDKAQRYGHCTGKDVPDFERAYAHGNMIDT